MFSSHFSTKLFGLKTNNLNTYFYFIFMVTKISIQYFFWFLTGWTMQMFRCMYIHRDWKMDESIMEKMLSHYSTIQNEREPPNNFQLILFPEGTNLTPETKRKSNAFAAKNNLKPLNHLLHPRTTGFSYIANKMRYSKLF